jgi:predicted N-acyltransferase
MRSAIHHSIEDLEPAEWNALVVGGYPFLRHEFLAALEHSGCVGPETGWQPRYFAMRDAAGLAAAAPAFLKSHSYGEFVFDFAWAQAYARYGERYYPKLTVAAPFTPATGPRLLSRPAAAGAATALLAAIRAHAEHESLSSIHALFVDEPAREACAAEGWLLRRDCQFHWHNRGYASFEHYLESFTSEKRKKAHRERRRVAEGGVRFETLLGAELDERQLDIVFELHRDTFLRHGHEPYLNRAFFGEIARSMGTHWLVKLARVGREPVAAAVLFRSQATLYGRYWGAAADFHSLHFETCYHQGIEYCIAEGLQSFEPGTQGEHKVSRGFEPALTWSAHFVADRRFRDAIAEYLGREGAAVDEYAREIGDHLPFRNPA